MSTPATFDSPTLNTPYALTPEQVQQFQDDGFIKLKDVFDAETLAYYAQEITRLTLDLNPNKGTPLEERSTYNQAFIQIGNQWERSEIAREFSFSNRLAQLATELLGVSGVRMYHDQSLFKEPSGGFTPWHVDQYYWPMSTAMTVTAWIPLQAVPLEMGPLSFGKGSHRKHIAREVEISEESDQMIRDEVKRQKIVDVYEPYDLGEVSFHYGWTLHRAGGNTTEKSRNVHCVIYMDENMVLGEPKSDHEKHDWKDWSPSTQVGEVMADALNPVLYSTKS
ncbi:MAG: phytanoyl-CoA dioxygenase family protein [Algisphaera sp.]